MNDNNTIAVIVTVVFLSMGGCLVSRDYIDSTKAIEREKTKQMEIQARADSTRIVNQAIISTQKNTHK